MVPVSFYVSYSIFPAGCMAYMSSRDRQLRSVKESSPPSQITVVFGHEIKLHLRCKMGEEVSVHVTSQRRQVE